MPCLGWPGLKGRKASPRRETSSAALCAAVAACMQAPSGPLPTAQRVRRPCSRPTAWRTARACAASCQACRVQASAAELRAALEEMGAVELSGRWCLVDPAYMGGLLELLILT